MRSRFDRVLLALIAVIFAVHGAAVAQSWYFVHPWIDIPMHIFSGFWIGLLFFYLFLERRRILSADIGFIPLTCLAIGFVASMGIAWEFYEYLLQVYMGNLTTFGDSLPGVHFDTLKDLFDDLMGGILAMLWYYWFRMRRFNKQV